jgi:hypothetical protein
VRENLAIFIKINLSIMATLTVEVEDNELNFLRDLLKRFPFVRVSEEIEEDSDEEVRANIREGIRQMDLVEEGSLQTRPAREFLKEL